MMSNQILSIEERIQISIAMGESHFREFKSALEGPPNGKRPRKVKDVCEDIAKTLVAFANADGGELLVGVEDDGNITGIEYSEDNIEKLKNAPKTHIHLHTPLPQYKIRLVSLNYLSILYFSIPSGSEFCYLTADGRCLQRKDLESVPVSSEEIQYTKNEKLSKQYDRNYIPTATTSDLDISLISEVADHISKGMSAEKCLQHLELAEYYDGRLLLKKAALLLFANDINKWHPRVQVRVIRVDGNELNTGKDYNAKYDTETRNCIMRIIDTSWELLRPHLTETRISDDAIFKTQIIYPELACREALINAIAHRDYNNEGAGIEIYVYDNRIEITNPGGLLSSISIEDLRQQRGVHQSRNALIAKVLREVGYMRELGEGIRRIYKLMHSNDLADPVFETTTTQFQVSLFQKYVYSNEEKLWLDNFSHLNLSRAQKTIIRLGCHGRLFSAQEIWNACGIVDTEEFRKLIQSLYNYRILENIYPSKQLQKIALSKSITKKQIKKFKIILPQQAENSHSKPLDEADYAKIFVANLPYNCNKEKLEQVFSQFGEIEDVFIPIDFTTQKQKGFAFIEFTSKKDALLAIAQSTALDFETRKLFINWANPRQKGA